MKKGFTLVEILIAVMIVAILVAMAVPMYEKTIEKSRMAEVRTVLKRIYDSKMRLMEDMEVFNYLDGSNRPRFGFENLDYTFRCSGGTSSSNGHVVKCATKDFTYVLNPNGAQNSVCAARRSGDNEGVNILYGLVGVNKVVQCNRANVPANQDGCGAYGMPDTPGNAWCTPGVDVAPVQPEEPAQN
ncbi:MAG: prepilin-type N-terminal cleavage/methylation domain-containing protein [Elusimicrobiaceae bacterium]|nr:prepilin-type N-terminal cleavage/methylation domain-containing protein [Elusimicrobiaceae bacterium]